MKILNIIKILDITKTSNILIILVALIFIQSCSGYQIVSLGTNNYHLSGVSSSGYTVQVGAFKDVNRTISFVDDLNNLDLDAFLYKEDGLYKVRFGDYKTYKEAKYSAEALVKARKISSYYIVKPESLPITKSKTVADGDTYIRNGLVKSAHNYKGIPYQWGGTSPTSGFDCSGLTRAVYRLNGIEIPRVSVDQFRAGVSVKKKNLKKGDLVFFITSGRKINHVGVYVGKNQFIHAPSRGKTVRIDKLNSPYWSNNYKGARGYLK